MKTAALVAARNAQRHLVECLESLDEFDAIVIYDDCSADATAAIARVLGYPVIRGDIHMGQVAAKFLLARNCLAEYFAFVDSDDWRIGGALSEQVATLDDSGAAVCVGPSISTATGGEIGFPADPWLMAYTSTMATSATLWRTSEVVAALHAIEPDDANPELQLLTELLLRDRRVVWSQTPAAYYRESWSPDQMSRRNDGATRRLRARLFEAAPDRVKRAMEILDGTSPG